VRRCRRPQTNASPACLRSVHRLSPGSLRTRVVQHECCRSFRFCTRCRFPRWRHVIITRRKGNAPTCCDNNRTPRMLLYHRSFSKDRFRRSGSLSSSVFIVPVAFASRARLTTSPKQNCFRRRIRVITTRCYQLLSVSCMHSCTLVHYRQG